MTGAQGGRGRKSKGIALVTLDVLSVRCRPLTRGKKQENHWMHKLEFEGEV